MDVLGVVSLLKKINVSAVKTFSAILNLKDANFFTRQMKNIAGTSMSLNQYIPFLYSVQITDVCIVNEKGIRKTVYSLHNKVDEERDYSDEVVEKMMAWVCSRKNDGISGLISKFFTTSSNNDVDADNWEFIKYVAELFCPEMKRLTESKFCSDTTVCLLFDAASLDLRDWRNTITQVLGNWKTMFDLNRVDATTMNNSVINVVQKNVSKKTTLLDISDLNNECIRDIELVFSYATPISAPLDDNAAPSTLRRKRRASSDISNVDCKRVNTEQISHFENHKTIATNTSTVDISTRNSTAASNNELDGDERS